MSGLASTDGYGIATDGQGNVYVSGAFNGSKVNFDPNNPNPAPSAYLTSQYTEDAFIAKYSAAGLLQWATDLGNDTLGGAGVYYVGLAISGSSVYATGNFAGKNTALAQLNASNGSIVSSVTTQELGGYGLGIAVDPSGNVYVTGSTATSQALVAKFDASLNPLWTKTTTTTSGGTTDATTFLSGARIAVDGSGNAYVTGGYTGTLTFGSTTLTSWGGTEDVFVWRLDTNGNSTWAGSMGSNGSDLGTGIAVDGSGNLYVTGSWGQGSSSASTNNNFNPGPGGAVQLTHQSNGSKGGEGEDIFVVKLVPATGGTSYTAQSPGWAKDIGGTYSNDSRALALDAAGNIYITGLFMGTVQFGPYTLQSYGSSHHSSGQPNIYVAELNSSGTVVAAVSATGNRPSFGEALAVDGSGNVYSTGWLRGTANFNPNGTYDLTANDPSGDVYVWKLTPPSASAATSGMLLTPTTVSSTSKSQDKTAPSSTSVPSSSSPTPTADQLFANIALILSDAGNAHQLGMFSLPALWQSINALALQRLDALLSMEAGAMGVTKDSLMRDLFFAGLPASIGV